MKKSAVQYLAHYKIWHTCSSAHVRTVLILYGIADPCTKIACSWVPRQLGYD